MPYGKATTLGLLAKAQFSKNGIGRVSFLPMKIDQKYRPEVLRNGDKRFAEFLAYMEWVSEDMDHQFKVGGDEVVVTYYEGLAAEFKKKGESKTIGVLDATTGTARMPEGSGRPGAAVANKVKTTVVIESVDTKTHSVTFTGPSGLSRTVDVVDPKAQKFIAELKKGDEVELTYVEALAVTVEPKLAK